MLIRAISDRARADGVGALYASVREDNSASLRAFAAAGFTAADRPAWRAAIEAHYQGAGHVLVRAGLSPETAPDGNPTRR